MATCRAPSCRAPIRWVQTLAGKNMPLDPMPRGDGTFAFVEGMTDTVRPVDDPDEAGVDRYMPHWATCPASESFRKSR